MAISTGGDTIEATLGRFFNTEELAARPMPDLYQQAADFHTTYADIINHPMSTVAALTLDEPTGELRHERFWVEGMPKRSIWLGLDTVRADQAYGFVVSGFGHRGLLYRYDVAVRYQDGSQETTLYVSDGQSSLLRKRQLTDVGAQMMVSRAADFLLTHPETERAIEVIRGAQTKATAAVADVRVKQDKGANLTSEEKKALKSAAGRGLKSGPWRSMDGKVPRIS
jgi:hypothetical protein